MTKNYLTVRQVAEKLEMHPDHVRKLARERKLPLYRLVRGGDWRITVEELEAYLKGRMISG